MDQIITNEYMLVKGDCIDVMQKLPENSVHLSIYSPPFCGLYNYSSHPRDLSNCDSYSGFFEHYEFVVSEIKRLTVPGRMTAVHCMDIPKSNTGRGDSLTDFPGDIIRLHQKLGFSFVARYAIWKEPLAVRNRTLMKSLAHKTIVDDSSKCSNAGGDYLLIFRTPGDNETPVSHPEGLSEYYGERQIPEELNEYRGWTGLQIENRLSHWIWRQYASCFWDDIRLDNVLPYKSARDSDDEKHVHPLQLDVIARVCTLFSNPDETVLTPFMGVGSEVHNAVTLGRKSIGIELKESYFNQAVTNLQDLRRLVHDDTGKITETYSPTFPGTDVTGQEGWEMMFRLQS